MNGCMEVCTNSASVFCFTETWMKPEIPLPSVSGYQVFHSPFITHKSNAAGKIFNTKDGAWERQEHTPSQHHLLSEHTKQEGATIFIGAILKSTI